MQESLRYAEDAAATATSECATLAAAVQAVTEQDAKARSSLAHRAYQLKESLLQTAQLCGSSVTGTRERGMR